MSVVDEIKDKLPIEELVGQYVQLKKTGRSLKGLCPFHSEKTPSFIVSPERGIAYCFGCNKGGDVFRFIQEVEGVDFSDALKILAERTGVKLENKSFEKTLPKDQKDLLYEIHEKAARFYEWQLWNTGNGLKVLEYLRKRGIKDESIRLFRVGFSPDSYEETYTNLLKEGFSRKTLVSAGLAHSQETTVEKVYDRFRGRLMFPIFDHMGRVAGFGGRALKKEQDPKYLNSPETPIYHKSSILYGYSHGKNSIKQTSEAVIVEGYMDLIATFQEGVRNTVATSGTALTIKQLRLLKPFVKTVVLAFDMDLAGQEAAKRAYELARDFDYTIRIISIPEGKDPADYAASHPGELVNVVKNALEYGEFFYRKLLATYGTDGFSAKRKILQEFLPLFHELKSTIEKDEFVRRLANDLDLKEGQIYDEIKNAKLPSYHPARIHGPLHKEPVEAKKYGAADLLTGFIINFGRVAHLLHDKMSEDLFPLALKPIYKAYTDQYNDTRVESGFDIVSRLPGELRESAQVLSLYVSEEYGEMSEEAAEKEMSNLIEGIRKNSLNLRTKELEKGIRDAEKKGDKDLCRTLMSELSNLRSYGAN